MDGTFYSGMSISNDPYRHFKMYIHMIQKTEASGFYIWLDDNCSIKLL